MSMPEALQSMATYLRSLGESDDDRPIAIDPNLAPAIEQVAVETRTKLDSTYLQWMTVEEP